MEGLLIDFSPELIHLISKVLLSFFLGVYLIFAFLLARQVTIMNKVLTTTDSATTRFLGLIHFIVATVVFVLVVFLF
jgi:hypothetical protein